LKKNAFHFISVEGMTDKKIRTMTKINSQLQNSADLLYIEKLAEDT